MMEALEGSQSSAPVFDAYEPLWEEVSDDTVLAHTLFMEGNDSFQVTDVAWNATGSVLAVSFGRLGTLGWCDYNSYLGLWNLFKTTPNKPGVPDLRIDVTGCVLCMAFHPTKPNLLVGGTYNGELV